MKIIIVGTRSQINELGAPRVDGTGIVHVDKLTPEGIENADAVIDLSFENTPSRVKQLEECGAGVVVINSVMYTLAETSAYFVRMNGWPTMLGGAVVEAAALNDSSKQQAEAVFSALKKSIEWTPDMVGFITPRVISTIINEAYFALEEGVSTEEEINTAMKLGTNYPYGPFEWAEKIGLENVVALLQKLSGEQERYKPSQLMVDSAPTIVNIQQTNTEHGTSK